MIFRYNENQEQWHKHFYWFPKRFITRNGGRAIVWLSSIWRRKVPFYYCYVWEYSQEKPEEDSKTMKKDII